ITRGIDLHDSEGLSALSVNCSIRFAYQSGEALPSRIFFDDEDVTEKIRTPQIDRAVSPVSACPGLREDMLYKQRKLGSEGDYVVEGRDIGSVVFPDAELKIFLTAEVGERARRRAKQNKQRGLPSDFEEIRQSLIARDDYDSNRAVAPLLRAEDAINLDTTHMSEGEVIQRIVDLAKERLEQAHD
ncbi:MAG: (d)CMP kinase, partial [Coriobacteriia bacterium]|nr:(d)CMP kinase [Coriobacteriia bacterium]